MTAGTRGGPAASVWHLFATLFIATTLALTGYASVGSSVQTPRNIIIMFADGAAPTQWDFGKYSSGVLRKQSFATTDVVRRARQRRRRVDARAMGVRRCGQGRARVPATQPRHARDRDG